MTSRWLSVLASILILNAALVLFFGLEGPGGPNAPAIALAAPRAAPTVTAVDPAIAPNDLDTTITITGTNFAATPGAWLGSTPLFNVTWLSSTSLTATVPFNLAPGFYALTVTNPDGQSGSLPNAFTVTRGLGVWTTGGPYGGEMVEVVPHPVISTKVYALVLNSGLFASDDAASHWQPALFDTWPVHLSIDPHSPTTMYLGSYWGVYRTQDGGSTWSTITPAGLLGNTPAFPIAHPITAGIVYVGASASTNRPPEPSEPVGVYRSTDYGANWELKNTGLTDKHVTALAFFPDDPTGLKMVAGTRNGNIFETDDGGQNWQWVAKPADYIGKLYVNPSRPQDVWAVRPMLGGNYVGASLFKNRDASLTVWDAVSVTPSPNSLVSSLAFDSTGPSGTIWATMTNAQYGVYKSTDGGSIWTGVATSPPEAISLAVNAANTQILYIGNRCGAFDLATVCGVYKSPDRGATWSEANEGLAGLSTQAVAVSPATPDKVYAYTGLGLLKSTNGARTWQSLGISAWGFPAESGAMAVDPSMPTKLYLGCSTSAPPWGLPCVKTGGDDGLGWHVVTLTLPAELSGWGGQTFAVAPHPTRPGKILAGVTFYPPGFDWTIPSRPLGGIYASNNYGEHWSQMTVTLPISGVVGITHDATNANLIYASTDGTGVLKSTDGGASWNPLPVPAEFECTNVHWLGTHPFVSNTLYVDCNHGSARSTDAGASWTALPNIPFRGTKVFVPTEPPVLYNGDRWGTGGLKRSRDEGQTWETVTGLPTNASVYALAAGRDEKRVVLYVASSGGLASPSSSVVLKAARTGLRVGAGGLMGGGIYRQAVVNMRLFLPNVSR